MTEPASHQDHRRRAGRRTPPGWPVQLGRREGLRRSDAGNVHDARKPEPAPPGARSAHRRAAPASTTGSGGSRQPAHWSGRAFGQHVRLKHAEPPIRARGARCSSHCAHRTLCSLGQSEWLSTRAVTSVASPVAGRAGAKEEAAARVLDQCGSAGQPGSREPASSPSGASYFGRSSGTSSSITTATMSPSRSERGEPAWLPIYDEHWHAAVRRLERHPFRRSSDSARAKNGTAPFDQVSVKHILAHRRRQRSGSFFAQQLGHRGSGRPVAGPAARPAPVL